MFLVSVPSRVSHSGDVFFTHSTTKKSGARNDNVQNCLFADRRGVLMGETLFEFCLAAGEVLKCEGECLPLVFCD